MPDSVATSTDFELGRVALLEITTAETIGEPAGSIDEGDGVVSVYFACTMTGYPGWRWTVSIAHVSGLEPGVLETELTPGDDALLSPAWVPWADRLAEYKETQAGLAASENVDSAGDDEEDDDDDDDFDDGELLHAGDLDGVDIDSLEDDDSSDDDDTDDTDTDTDDDDTDDDEIGGDSALTAGVDQAKQSESESGDAGPEPRSAARSRSRKRLKDNQHDD